MCFIYNRKLNLLHGNKQSIGHIVKEVSILKIKNVGQLRKALENLEDDFEIEVLQVELFRNHLPNYNKHELLLEDIGYSNKVVVFGIGDEF